MKITGTRNRIEFDFENGHVAVAEGELLTGKRFVVYTDTIKAWEPPYNNKPFSNNDVQKIIDAVKAKTTKNTMQIIFE